MLRAAQPAMAFSTDVIVGFPGETDADFEETRTPSARRSTTTWPTSSSTRCGRARPAATMPGQVPDAVREERNQALLEVLRAGSLRRSQALVGTVQEVLVEGPDRTGLRFTGRTRGNRTAVFEPAPRLVGRSSPSRSRGRA
jgi:tRNA-2-methylthio-N6-dimethylallyladenosine synthase